MSELAVARRMCELAFEPLWRPAPHTVTPRITDPLAKADAHEAAKRTAWAWLGAQLKSSRPLASFDAFTLLDCERAFPIIANATINDVRAWADAQEAAA